MYCYRKSDSSCGIQRAPSEYVNKATNSEFPTTPTLPFPSATSFGRTETPKVIIKAKVFQHLVSKICYFH